MHAFYVYFHTKKIYIDERAKEGIKVKKIELHFTQQIQIDASLDDNMLIDASHNKAKKKKWNEIGGVREYQSDDNDNER